jgi:acyl carrier protein
MNHNRDEVFGELKGILVEMFEVEEADVVPAARLYEDLDIDSIDAVDLVVRLREMTGKRVDPEDFKAVRTVDDVVETTLKLLAS